MKKMSLKTKIILYITIIPVCSFAVICFLTVMNMHDLKKFAMDCSKELSDGVADQSIMAIKDEAVKELKMLSEGQALITRLQLQRINAEVNNLAETYKRIIEGHFKNTAPNDEINSKTSFDPKAKSPVVGKPILTGV